MQGDSPPAGVADGWDPSSLRVLVVSGLYPRPDDPMNGLFVHRQTAALRAAGVEVEVVCPVARQLLPFRAEGAFASGLDGAVAEEVEGVPVTYVPYRHVPHRLSTRLEAMSLVRTLTAHLESTGSDRPDLVHGHWLFPAGWAATELASRWGTPSLVTAHGSDVHRYPEENRGTARFTRQVLRRADRTVSVSGALARRMRELAGDGRSPVVVYNGVDADTFRPAGDRGPVRDDLGLPERGTGICSVGRLVEEKGTRELLDAFRRVAGEVDGLWLALVGEGRLRGQVEARAREAGLADRVFLPGAVAHDEVSRWLRAADVFALPSYAEGLPVSVLEAMACGLPVVATDVGGIPEVVDETVGRLVRARETGPLAERLAELVSDPGLRRRMGVEARRRIEEDFTWRRSAERLLDVYRELTAAGRDAALVSEGAERTGPPEASVPEGGP